MKINKMMNDKVIGVKSVGMVETAWGVLYNYYEDMNGTFYGDMNDDGREVMELRATTKEEAEAEMKEYVAALAAELAAEKED